MRAFVYLRQSLDRNGTHAAVDRQREDCLRLAAQRGWTVVRTFVDNDVSASSRKPRPEYVNMLAAVEKGEADVIVAWHVDRLTRKLTDLEHLIELGERKGLRVATVTGDLDLTTDTGRLLGRILASVARGEVERKGARQKRAQQQAAQAGKPMGGRRAFGYGPDGITVVEDEAQLVKAAYADLLAGSSLKAIAREWNEAGVATTACRLTRDHSTHQCSGTPCEKRTDHARHTCVGGEWRHDNVRTVLKNPRYAGLRAYRGEIVGDAVWKPIVDRDTFDAVHAVLSLPDRRTTTVRARRHLLPGLASCWKCGSDVATGHTSRGVRTYVCRAGKHVSRKAEPVDELVTEVILRRLERPDAGDLLVVDASEQTTRARERGREIRSRLDDLAVALEEGILSLAAVRQSSERLRVELAAVDAEIAAASARSALLPLLEARDVREKWKELDLRHRREVIDTLVTVTLLKPEQGRNVFDADTVRIEWKGDQ